MLWLLLSHVVCAENPPWRVSFAAQKCKSAVTGLEEQVEGLAS